MNIYSNTTACLFVCLFNQSEPRAKIETPFLAYQESSKMKLFAKYRLQSHLSKHQLKIVLYLVVHILPLKIIFLMISFLYILVRQATYQEISGTRHLAYKNFLYILLREMPCTRKSGTWNCTPHGKKWLVNENPDAH